MRPHLRRAAQNNIGISLRPLRVVQENISITLRRLRVTHDSTSISLYRPRPVWDNIGIGPHRPIVACDNISIEEAGDVVLVALKLPFPGGHPDMSISRWLHHAFF
jgi:hypothetical protein